jgi:protein O-GlcNAc transferase
MARYMGSTVILALLLVFPWSPHLGVERLPLMASQATSDSLDAGVSLLDQKRFAEARDVFLRLTHRHPHSAEGFFYLGLAELNLGNIQIAEKYLQQSLALKPDSPNTLYDLGIILLKQKRPSEAIPLLEKARILGPSTPELMVNLVRAYLDAGQKHEALGIVNSVEGRFASDPRFQLALGKTLAAHQLLPEARLCFEKTNQLVPGQLEVVFPLAEVCLELRDASCARHALGEIAQKAGHTCRYHYLLAQTNLLLHANQQALLDAQEAARCDPQNPFYLVFLGKVYQKLGDQQKAVQVFEHAARIAPDLPEIPYGIGLSYFIADDFNQASRYAKYALQLDPTYERAIFLLAISQFAMGDFKNAQTSFQRALELEPDNQFNECFLGMLLLQENRLSEAKSHLERAIRLNPSYALPHYQLGRLLTRMDNYEQASIELEKALMLEPDLAGAYYILAHAYLRLGQSEKAHQAMVAFQKLQRADYSEREEILKQVHQAIPNLK